MSISSSVNSRPRPTMARTRERWEASSCRAASCASSETITFTAAITYGSDSCSEGWNWER